MPIQRRKNKCTLIDSGNHQSFGWSAEEALYCRHLNQEWRVSCTSKAILIDHLHQPPHRQYGDC